MLGSIAKHLRVAARRSETAWRYGYNLPKVLRYRLGRTPRASDEVQRVVATLNQDGVARTSVAALLSSPASFQNLQDEVEELQRVQADAMADARRRGGITGTKTYSYEFFRTLPDVSPIHLQFASQPEIRQVADAYLGLTSRLRGANTWLTLISKGEAQNSQVWHRDPEDRYVVKIFALLSEVDDQCGPFYYARRSHMKSRDERVKRCAKYGLTDDEMAALVPRDQWFIGTGSVGTIVFADTRGYHKGGLARERERLVFMGMYLAF